MKKFIHSGYNASEDAARIIVLAFVVFATALSPANLSAKQSPTRTAMRTPTPTPASRIPLGLTLRQNGAKTGLINGTPTVDPNVTYTNGYHDYSVTISERTSCGTTPDATLTIRIYR